MARSKSTNLTVPGAPMRQIEASDRRSLALNLLISLRPGQWTQNFAVFAAVVFAEKLFDVRALVVSGAAFVIFCALSGVVYLINDIADRRSDREHPIKRRRPIASGALPVPVAAAAAAMIGVVALAAAFSVGWSLGLVAAGYV